MAVSLKEEDKNLLEAVVDKVEGLSEGFQKASIAEYIEMVRNPWRMMYLNFLGGIMRGFGIAVGFSAVGALFLYILGKVATLNLPIIGHFIAEIMRFVELERKLQ